MSFFFDDVDNSAKAKRPRTIPLNTAKQLGCTVCPLKRGGAYNPDMPAWGAKEPTVYFLGEAPGELEDRQNRPFIGPSGALLKENIPDQFLRDYRLNNTVRSRPPANRAPTELELACCRASIVKDIHESKPKVIVAIGNTALQWLFADENDKGDLTKMLELAKWRGRFFPVNIEGYVCWGYCIYHPSYILRNRKTGKDGQVYKGNFDYLFEADMKNLFASVNMPPAPAVDPKHYLSGIVTTEGLRSDRELTKVLNWLEKAKQFKKVALDYETTAIRPFKPGEKILTVSIGTFDWSCAFPLDYPNAWSTTQKEKLDTAFRQFLEYPNIKIAHNAKFELEWSSFFYGKDLPKIMKFEDTQAMAYTLDERKGTHNLDILVRTYFGFWLKKLSNLDRSRMASYSLAKILPYNALDTKWTFALYEQQQELLHKDKKLLSVYQRLLPCMQMLSALQLRGVVYNEKVLNQLMEVHKKALTQIQQNIWKLPEAKQYKQQFNEPFNIGSPTATISMYRDVLGREKDITTESGKLSTDESMLGKLIDPLSKMILEWRGHSKVISTYLEPLPGYVMPDGRIHTNYNLYETSTGRLCVAKGTMIEIVRDHSLYPNGIPVENVKAGDYAYTFDDNLNVVLRRVTWSGKTGTKKVMRIHWVGTGNKTKGYIDLTCNHPVRMIDGNYRRADQLHIGDRVLAITKTIANGRVKFWQTGKHDPIANHRFVYQQMIGDIPENWDVHHKDHNSLNDTPQNLSALSNAEHFRLHANHHWSIPGNGVYTASTIPNNHKITKIEWLDDLVDVYDLGVEDTHNFIGNSIALSNSSDSPNLQNFPSKTGKEPRGIIKAPTDHILICCDYGQIEARLIGAASQDPVFCKALWENYDVHMEWAKKIAEIYPAVVGGERFLEDKKAMKKFRSAVKNLWVFPAFYGASYISIAAGLKIPQDLAKELFDEFWEQFAGVRKWQRWLGNRYNELGYAESLFGRRRHAPLTHNAVINSPIQSTASDICVLSMVDLNSMGMDVVLNVHDEIGVYVHEDDLDETMDKMVRVMTKPRLSWLNIPIAVEVKIGYDWFNMEDVKTVDSTEFYKVPQGLIDFRTIYDM